MVQSSNLQPLLGSVILVVTLRGTEIALGLRAVTGYLPRQTGVQILVEEVGLLGNDVIILLFLPISTLRFYF